MNKVKAAMKPHPLEQPASGYHRIACGEPCQVAYDNRPLDGMVWNLSVVGVYVVLGPPLPEAGDTLVLTFTLPGDPRPITCQGRVRWHNPPSIFKGCGRTKLGLPPGCGIEFTVLDSGDAERIEARVRSTVASAR
jgi:hypothetical protein